MIITEWTSGRSSSPSGADTAGTPAVAAASPVIRDALQDVEKLLEEDGRKCRARPARAAAARPLRPDPPRRLSAKAIAIGRAGRHREMLAPVLNARRAANVGLADLCLREPNASPSSTPSRLTVAERPAVCARAASSGPQMAPASSAALRRTRLGVAGPADHARQQRLVDAGPDRSRRLRSDPS